jgi:hypothetical protein
MARHHAAFFGDAPMRRLHFHHHHLHSEAPSHLPALPLPIKEAKVLD